MTDINNLGDKPKRNLYEEAKARGAAFNKQVEEEKRREDLDAKLGKKPESIVKRSPVYDKINPSDYVGVPGYDLLIGKKEKFKGKTWHDAHFELAKNGLFMPTVHMFMKHFVNVRNAYVNGSPIYNGLGERLRESEIRNIWKSLSSDHGGGCFTWLDTIFRSKDGIMLMEENHYVVGSQIESRNELDFANPSPSNICYYVGQTGLVDLNFNNQGFPTGLSIQKYIPGKNIYFIPPSDGHAATFSSNSKLAGLDCSSYEINYQQKSPGVFPCVSPKNIPKEQEK